MIADLIAWLSSLPPLAIYAAFGAVGLIENIFPPVPSDTVIALGTLLSLEGHINVWLVFGITLSTNLLSAMWVYWFTRTHSETVFDSKLAKRLLPPAGVHFVRTEYQRFGLTGLLIARFLPGFRAIVPPFAGLIGLPPLQVAAVLALASSIWYGGIIYMVSSVGQHWDDITRFLGQLNRGIGITAAVTMIALGTWIWWRIRKHRRGE